MNNEDIIRMVKSPMFKNLMGDQAEDIAKLVDDPKMANQMTGFWKQLDEMAATDEKSYREFIEKQKQDFEKEQEKINQEKEQKRIIQGTPLCCIKVLPAKVLQKNERENLSDTIKLFDFEKSEIEKSFLENADEGKALEQPKLYLNILHSDKVVKPLLQNREQADPNDDSTWKIIPISFGQNKERWSESGKKCIHIDAYVSTCVFETFKKGATKIGALTNYIIQKFQNLLKDHFLFHKKSIKILKTKKYKAWRGPNDTVGEYILPEAFHIDHYDKILKKIR